MGGFKCAGACGGVMVAGGDGNSAIGIANSARSPVCRVNKTAHSTVAAECIAVKCTITAI